MLSPARYIYTKAICRAAGCSRLCLGARGCHTFLLLFLKKSVTGLRPPEAGVAGVAGVRLPYTGLLVMKSF